MSKNMEIAYDKFVVIHPNKHWHMFNRHK